MNRKGVWQHLKLTNYGDSSYIEPYLYFELPDNAEVKSLKGYVIFAYMNFNVTDSITNSHSNTTFTPNPVSR